MKNILTGETIQTELHIANDTIILTDKRLLFNDSFIGLRELKSATINSTKVKQAKYNIRLGNVWFIMGMLITLIFATNYGINKHGRNLYGDIMAGMILFALVGAGISAIIVWIISTYIKSTATVTIFAEVTITKNDNSVFLRTFFDSGRYDELSLLCFAINNAIYK